MGSQSKIIFPTSSYISFNFLGLIINMPSFQNRFVASFAEEVALELLSQDRQKTKLCQGIHRILMMLFCTGLAWLITLF